MTTAAVVVEAAKANGVQPTVTTSQNLQRLPARPPRPHHPATASEKKNLRTQATMIMNLNKVLLKVSQIVFIFIHVQILITFGTDLVEKVSDYAFSSSFFAFS